MKIQPGDAVRIDRKNSSFVLRVTRVVENHPRLGKLFVAGITPQGTYRHATSKGSDIKKVSVTQP